MAKIDLKSPGSIPNYTLKKNLKLDSNYISNDGSNEGMLISDNGSASFWVQDSSALVLNGSSQYANSGNILSDVFNGIGINTYSYDFNNRTLLGGAQLNGSDEYFTVSDHNDFDMTSAISISFWIKPDSLTSWDRIIDKESNDGSNNNGFLVAIVNNSILFRVNENEGNPSQDSQHEGSIDLVVGEWHHVVCTFDSSTLKIYVNNVADTTQAYSDAIVANSADLYIGRYSVAASNMFDGSIKEVAIWNTALDAANIAAIYSYKTSQNLASDFGAYDRSSSLKGYWKMDETSGSNASDSSGGSHTATGTGIADSNWNTPAINEYITIGDQQLVSTTGSISAWIKVNSVGTNRTVAAKFDAGNNLREWLLMVDSNDKIIFSVQDDADAPDNNTIATGTTSLSVDTWYHVVGTFSPSGNVKIYLNKELEDTSTNPATNGCENTAEEIYIGRNGDGAYFDGTIQNVAIWDVELTAGDVEDLYNSGLPTDLQDPSSYDSSGEGKSGTNLKGWWKLNNSLTDETGSNDATNNSATAVLGNVPNTGSTSKFTISSWIKPESISGTQAILGKYNAAGNAKEYRFYQTDGKLKLDISEDAAGSTVTTYSVDGDDTNFIDFDGVNDYVNAGDVGQVENIDTLTVSFWVKADEDNRLHTAGGYELVCKGQSTGDASWTIAWSETQRINVTVGERGTDNYFAAHYNITSAGKEWVKDTWTLFTIVYNYDSSTMTNSYLKFYFNGELIRTQTGYDGGSPQYSGQFLRIPNTSHNLTFGAGGDSLAGGSVYYNGKMREVGIWNAILNDSNVAAIYNLGVPGLNLAASSGGYTQQGNLVGYWKMNEGAGNADDTTSNNNNGTLTGASWASEFSGEDTSTQQLEVGGGTQGWYHVAVTGNLQTNTFTIYKNGVDVGKYSGSTGYRDMTASSSSSSLYFNNTLDAHVTIPNVNLGTANTISLWIKWINISSPNDIQNQPLGKTTWGGGGYALYFSADKLYARVADHNVYWDDSAYTAKLNNEILAGNWVHVALVRTGTETFKLYINGDLMDPDNNSGVKTMSGLTAATEIDTIGAGWDAYDDPYNEWEGYIDEVAFFNDVKDQTFIQNTLYNSGVAPVLSASTADLVRYYRFEGNLLDINGSNGGTGYNVAYSSDRPQGLINITDIDSTATNIGIGSSHGGAAVDLFNGTMDDVAIWDAELDSDDILKIYNNGSPSNLEDPVNYDDPNSQANLKAYWKFDEGSGTNTIDQISEVNSSLQGSPAWADGVPSEKFRVDQDGVHFFQAPQIGQQASLNTGIATNIQNTLLQAAPRTVSFNGTDEYIACGDVADADNIDNLSIAFWVNFTSTAGTQGLISKGDYNTNNDCWSLKLASGELYFSVDNDVTAITTGINFSIDAWYHLLITYSNADDVIKIYKDGVDIETISKTYLTVAGSFITIPTNGSKNVLIGKEHSGNYFKGKFQEIGLWNIALSSADVTAIYNNGRTLNLSQSHGNYSSQGSLKAYWKLNENTGNSFADSSTASNTGTGTNMDSTNWTDGKVISILNSSYETLDVYRDLKMHSNIRLNGNYISNDGDNEGISIADDGGVEITKTTGFPLKLKYDDLNYASFQVKNRGELWIRTAGDDSDGTVDSDLVFFPDGKTFFGHASSKAAYFVLTSNTVNNSGNDTGCVNFLQFTTSNGESSPATNKAYLKFIHHDTPSSRQIDLRVGGVTSTQWLFDGRGRMKINSSNAQRFGTENSTMAMLHLYKGVPDSTDATNDNIPYLRLDYDFATYADFDLNGAGDLKLSTPGDIVLNAEGGEIYFNNGPDDTSDVMAYLDSEGLHVQQASSDDSRSSGTGGSVQITKSSIKIGDPTIPYYNPEGAGEENNLITTNTSIQLQGAHPLLWIETENDTGFTNGLYEDPIIRLGAKGNYGQSDDYDKYGQIRYDRNSKTLVFENGATEGTANISFRTYSSDWTWNTNHPYIESFRVNGYGMFATNPDAGNITNNPEATMHLRLAKNTDVDGVHLRLTAHSDDSTYTDLKVDKSGDTRMISKGDIYLQANGGEIVFADGEHDTADVIAYIDHEGFHVDQNFVPTSTVSGDNFMLQQSGGLLSSATPAEVVTKLGVMPLTGGTFTGNLTVTQATGPQLTLGYDANEKFTVNVADNGVTTMSTTDNNGGGTAANLVLDIDGDIDLDAGGGDISFSAGGTAYMAWSAAGQFTLKSVADTSDSFGITVGSSAATTISTSDTGGTSGNLIFDADGDILIKTKPGGAITLQENDGTVYTPSAASDAVPLNHMPFVLYTQFQDDVGINKHYLPLRGYFEQSMVGNEPAGMIAPFNMKLQKAIMRCNTDISGATWKLGMWALASGTSESHHHTTGMNWVTATGGAINANATFDFTGTVGDGTNSSGGSNAVTAGQWIDFALQSDTDVTSSTAEFWITLFFIADLSNTI